MLDGARRVNEGGTSVGVEYLLMDSGTMIENLAPASPTEITNNTTQKRGEVAYNAGVAQGRTATNWQQANQRGSPAQPAANWPVNVGMFL